MSGRTRRLGKGGAQAWGSLFCSPARTRSVRSVPPRVRKEHLRRTLTLSGLYWSSKIRFNILSLVSSPVHASGSGTTGSLFLARPSSSFSRCSSASAWAAMNAAAEDEGREVEREVAVAEKARVAGPANGRATSVRV